VQPGLDAVDHIGPDELLAMDVAQVLGGAADDLGGFLSFGVPGAARHERSTFELFHGDSPPIDVALQDSMPMRRGKGRGPIRVATLRLATAGFRFIRGAGPSRRAASGTFGPRTLRFGEIYVD
jgi:hypothetical protein